MSVLMTLVVNGDPSKLEEHAASDPEAMQAILDSARSHGIIAHRFYGSDDGRIMVVDVWPDEQSFQAFFDETEDRIGPLMQSAGVTSEPQPAFWRELESHDKHGWGA
jgi:heme-degrading monooxygenase HmoA